MYCFILDIPLVLDICPITLATLTQALAKLGNKKAADFQVIFVSVDYERNIPDVSNAFVKKFNTSFIGLSGTQKIKSIR